MQRIGIYAGTFDPIHDGHVGFAREALERAGLDKVYFLVEPRPRRKQGVKAMEHRLAMVELAIAAEPALGLIVLEQARFSVHDTWPVLQARLQGAELAMLMGEDVFMHLSNWPRLDEITGQVEFVVGLRTHDAAAVRAHMRTVEQTKGVKLNYQIFQSSAPDYASSKIRAIVKAGKQPEGLAPEVLKYIEKQGLYYKSTGSNS